MPNDVKLLGLMSLVAVGSLAACSTPSQVTTTDGQTTYTADAPDTESDVDFITYKKDGHKVKVNKLQVKKIEEVD